MTKEEIDTIMNDIEEKYCKTLSVPLRNGKSLKTIMDFLCEWELLKSLKEHNSEK